MLSAENFKENIEDKMCTISKNPDFPLLHYISVRLYYNVSNGVHMQQRSSIVLIFILAQMSASVCKWHIVILKRFKPLPLSGLIQQTIN